MTYDYLITLKKNNNGFADQVSQLLYVFALATFSYFFYQYPRAGLPYLFIIVAIIINWVVVSLRKKKDGQAFFRLGLLFAAAGWIIGFQRNIFMAALYALAGILEKQVKFPQEIGFSADGIAFNSLPRKTLQWSEVSNVVIKDGLLTIDQKNNKLYQKEIEGYVTGDIESEFNEFCRKCIHLHTNE